MTEKRRLLFITLSNIGDLVMTTPLLEALHLSYPDHLIDIVADARSSDLLLPCPYRGRIIHKEKKEGVRGSAKLVLTLRERHYDIAIDLRSALLTLFISCGQRGFKRSGTLGGQHAVQHHFTALGEISGLPVQIPPATLWLDDDAKERAAGLLADLPKGRRLVVAPGANWPGKVWPIEHYAALLGALEHHFDSVIVVGSKDDYNLGLRLKAAARLPILNLAGTTGLLEVAACMANASAFVGNDSGLGHMAAALKIPTVTVFGPGQPERYRPWGARATVVLAPKAELAALKADVVAEALFAHLASRVDPVQKVE